MILNLFLPFKHLSKDSFYTYNSQEKGVELVKEKRILDAFRRFSKALKMVVAIEPIDPEIIDEEKAVAITDLKVLLVQFFISLTIIIKL